MTANVHHGSAKIYQFPTRVRSPVGGDGEENKSAAHLASARLSSGAFGGAWYHEEAVQEAEQTRKTVHRLPTR